MRSNEDFISDLIYTATTAKHRQFKFLTSWREYRDMKRVRLTHSLLVTSLKQSISKQLKNYCKAITTGKTDVINLIAYCTTVEVLRFYEEELRILDDMIDEYECYLAHGNWIDFILGMSRPANKLYDHRGIIWKTIL